MSPETDHLDDPEIPREPERDEPLVARLRALRWPQADEATRERALRKFRELVDLPEPEPEAD